MRIVITLTAIPSRFIYIRETLQSLINQTVKPDIIYLFLPTFSTKEQCIYPSIDLTEYPLVRVVETEEDYGPITKLYPVLQVENDPDTLVITADDDTYYDSKLIEYLIQGWQQYCQPNDVACITGLIVGQHWYDAWCFVDHPNDKQQVDWPLGFKGALYPLRALQTVGNKFINWSVPQAKYADDQWIAAMLTYYANSKIIKVPRAHEWQTKDRDVANIMALKHGQYNKGGYTGLLKNLLTNRQIALEIRNKYPGVFQTQTTMEVIKHRYLDWLQRPTFYVAIAAVIGIILISKYVFGLAGLQIFLLFILLLILVGLYVNNLIRNFSLKNISV